MKKQNGLIAAAVAAVLSTPVYAADITISGALEVEASASEDYSNNNTSDVVVATAAVGLDAKINERVSATVGFLYEEDATDFNVDEGYITLQMNDTTSIVAGRMYVPFGNFASNMVSDPLTLELGETSETAVMMAMESGSVAGGLYLFNGDADDSTDTADNDELSFGANVGYAADNMGFGVSYISNIADSDMLAVNQGVADEVAGMGAHFNMNFNNVTVIAEYLAAADDFAVGDQLKDMDGNTQTLTKAITPSAANLEVAFDTGSATVAVAYQVTDEAVVLGMPESKASAAVSFEVMEGASMGIEYATGDDYETADGGTGKSDSAFTVQLAVEF